MIKQLKIVVTDRNFLYNKFSALNIRRNELGCHNVGVFENSFKVKRPTKGVIEMKDPIQTDTLRDGPIDGPLGKIKFGELMKTRFGFLTFHVCRLMIFFGLATMVICLGDNNSAFGQQKKEPKGTNGFPEGGQALPSFPGGDPGKQALPGLLGQAGLPKNESTPQSTLFAPVFFSSDLRLELEKLANAEDYSKVEISITVLEDFLVVLNGALKALPSRGGMVSAKGSKTTSVVVINKKAAIVTTKQNAASVDDKNAANKTNRKTDIENSQIDGREESIRRGMEAIDFIKTYNRMYLMAKGGKRSISQIFNKNFHEHNGRIYFKSDSEANKSMEYVKKNLVTAKIRIASIYKLLR